MQAWNAVHALRFPEWFSSIKDKSVSARGMNRLEVDGKFFRLDGERVFLNLVTYGPFPDPQPDHEEELKRVAEAGFHGVRVYEAPSEVFLDAASRFGLLVFVGVHWPWTRVFLGGSDRRWFEEGRQTIVDGLRAWGAHPAVASFFIANEVPSDLARWMGPSDVREALEFLIEEARAVAPHLLIAYASYPSSEYLEPSNADYTALNVYLEQQEKFSKYLKRLHHIAGDRPVLLSEFGLDTQRGGEGKQAEILQWHQQLALDAGMAGSTIFSWSDRWRVGAREVGDWDFGLTRRDGTDKLVLGQLNHVEPSDFHKPVISVIVCVYNGEERIGACLESLKHLRYPHFEVIVVDDGSTDGTREVIAKYPQAQLVQADHGGLSVARNLGAQAAQGDIFAYTDDDCEVDPDWLTWIARAYDEHAWDACGGPNIPPYPELEDEAVVAAAPGAPSHVMLDDEEAEHIPGCNLTVTRKAFEAIGGFRAIFRVAGDDVDFCWRLEAQGFRIGFHGAAFVWHRRRTTLYRYFKQQWGYGKAEALLMREHPDKFRRGGGARWKGCVYSGGAMGADTGAVIYHGVGGRAGYQQVVSGMMPHRALHRDFDNAECRRKLRMAAVLQPWLRRIARTWFSRKWRRNIQRHVWRPTEQEIWRGEERQWRGGLVHPDRIQPFLSELRVKGWEECEGYANWDMELRGGVLGTCRVLIATEVVGEESWSVRVRWQAMKKGEGPAEFYWAQILQELGTGSA